MNIIVAKDAIDDFGDTDQLDKGKVQAIILMIPVNM